MRTPMKRCVIVTAAFVGLSLGVVNARAQQPPPTLGESPAALIERARAAYTQGRYHDALATARRAAEAAPRSVLAQLARAGMAEFMGEFDEAMQAYAQAQALAPTDNTTRYRVALFATRVGDYDRALRELDAILATQPKAAQLFFRWAPPFVQKPLLKRSPALEQFVELQIDILMEEESTRVTSAASSKESGQRFVRIRLGGARPVSKRAESLFMIAKQRYLRDGDVEGAARLFDDSLRLSPTFARPYSYKARLALDEGDREAAVQWLRRGVEADPESWRTWH